MTITGHHAGIHGVLILNGHENVQIGKVSSRKVTLVLRDSDDRRGEPRR
jgi:hypothetical protein